MVQEEVIIHMVVVITHTVVDTEGIVDMEEDMVDTEGMVDTEEGMVVVVGMDLRKTAK